MANDYKFTITAMEIMPDHVHMLVDCSPQFEIPRMLKILKGNTARWMFLSHPEVKTKLWGGHLWNPSYCVVTVSDRSREQITNYINSQKKH
jgi:putative transposase